MPITVQDITDPNAYESNKSGNADLTEHYFDKKQDEFRVYRFNHHVYAVRYDLQTSQPRDFVHLWASNKKSTKIMGSKQEDSDLPVLGKGNEGKVYQTSADKVVKMLMKHTFKCKMKNNENSTSTWANTKILKQLFLLAEHQIDKFFVMGLWRNPATKINSYQREFHLVMPLVKSSWYDTKNPEDMVKYYKCLEEFIMALKTLNDIGYSHPDFGTLDFGNYYNEIYTQEGIKLIDLDKGFIDLNSASKESRVAGKDQWLYVYNYKTHTSGDKGWREEIQNWYSNNMGQSLSENPDALRELYANGKIHLPKRVVEELQLQSTISNTSGVVLDLGNPENIESTKLTNN
ncbi:hypothetical protein [Legionella waltersii]|uniref:Dot/Icm T4SS effector n=1 Tax=Legionella waltersii TaxID=66969 RepID=A0A0W1A2N6_9GAMM|nr:hypothetical protein [Legionella waltersii]KTD75613.1 Dot/Icm T4SS effector [Legionella waltersii]SNV03134.1 Dot/Icm T4SS effector [Legionella waltersii]